MEKQEVDIRLIHFDASKTNLEGASLCMSME